MLNKVDSNADVGNPDYTLQIKLSAFDKFISEVCRNKYQEILRSN